MRRFLACLLVFLSLAIPAAAQQANTTCALDAPVTDGGTSFAQCPVETTNDLLITKDGFNSARLEPTDNLSDTPIFVHNLCRFVDARGIAASLFIPFNTLAEWQAFINAGTAGVHLANCCLPRPLHVGDVPPITAGTNQTCATGWKFSGLADPNNFNNLLATPNGTNANDGFTLRPGITEDPNYPITALPLERDDLGNTLPTGSRSSQSYFAKYTCVTHSGNVTNTQFQVIQFDLQCANSNWTATGAFCASGPFAFFTVPCPNGGSGSDVKELVRACPSGEVTVQDFANTCTSQTCTPGQVGQPFNTACPDGQGGTQTVINVRQCPSGTITQQVIASTCDGGAPCFISNACPSGATEICHEQNNACVCSCSGRTCPASTDLGITTTNCPAGQTGQIHTHTFRQCSMQNNQCICSLAATEEDNCQTTGQGNCAAQTVITQTRACPAGQSGMITMQLITTCTAGANNTCSCSTTSQQIANTCTASCPPVQDMGNSTRACPSGQSGSITVNTKQLCGTQNGQCVCHNMVTTVSNTCTSGNSCTPSTDLGNITESCPAGQTGSIVVHRVRTCNPIVGCTQGGQCHSGCECQDTDTPVSNTCSGGGDGQCTPVTDLGNSTQACPSGQSGSITVDTKRVCQLEVGCSNGGGCHAQCVCHNEQTQISNTCSGGGNCPAVTDEGTQTFACPSGQTGSIVFHKTKLCTACGPLCLCSEHVETVSDTCMPVCTPSTDLGTFTRDCPVGQTGSITVDKVRVCTPCATGQCLCSDKEHIISDTCQNTCTPSSHTEIDQCPAGETGSITKTISHLCDFPGGRDVVTNVVNTCTPVCTPFTKTITESCPAGETGSIIKTIMHLCDCPSGRTVVTNITNTCQFICTPPPMPHMMSDAIGGSG